LWAKHADEVRILVFTGVGKFYCSGQELALDTFTPSDDEPLETAIRRNMAPTKRLIEEIIDFEKPIIGAVNGPAMGFGVTTLALFDMVFCAPAATFMTPFMKLGFCAEGCSSVTFPRMMGLSKAQEFLLLNKTFSAEEAVACNLVSRVFPQEGFVDHVLAHIQPLATYPRQAIAQTKALVFSPQERAWLKAVNEKELELLVQRFMSDECMEAIANFMAQRTSKRAKL
jgi:peroxisomal 3,2-trans-enoyl-CoA isomerase